MFHDNSVPLQAETYRLNTVSAAKTELAYGLVKYTDAEACTVPGWTGFHTMLQSNATLPKSALYYLPVIEASPTEMSTVNTILKRSVELADQLELDHVVLVFTKLYMPKSTVTARKANVALKDVHVCLQNCLALICVTARTVKMFQRKPRK